MKRPKRIRVGQIYKITYPNGKIYIGQDRTDDVNYFGSAHSETIRADFTKKQRRDMTIRKQIIVERRNTTVQTLNALERAAIEKWNSADPAVGYNRSPRGRRTVK
jgi:putative N-acetylmannosamine-6-phosphate epimerase